MSGLANTSVFDPFGDDRPPQLDTNNNLEDDFDDFDLLARRELKKQSKNKKKNKKIVINVDSDDEDNTPCPSPKPANQCPTPTRRAECRFKGCFKRPIIRGYCEKHIFEAGQAVTPGSKARKFFHKWSIEDTDDGSIDNKTPSDGVLIYNSALESTDPWPEKVIRFHVGALPDQALVTMKMTQLPNGDISPLLWINDLSWNDARRQWIQQRCYESALEISNSSAEKKTSDVPYTLVEKDFVKQHWKKSESTTKTKRGMMKKIVTWKFTINAKDYTLILEHGQFGGKRKIILNGEVKLEKKLGLLTPEVGGALPVVVDGLPCMVLISCNDKDFSYDLHIDGVPFNDNQITGVDYGSGNAWNMNIYSEFEEDEIEPSD